MFEKLVEEDNYGMTNDQLRKVFELTCRCRYFELGAAQAIRDGHIKIPTYLSVGQEHIAATLAVALPGWQVFAQHRCHSYYLCWGGDPEALAKELLGRSDGCNGGKGGSASISHPPLMFGHSGLLGDQVPIGIGAAFASKKPTLIVCGDGAVEEDYVLGALGFAATHKVPVLIVVEDNNLSILTEKKVRRSWDIATIAEGFGLEAVGIDDNVHTIGRWVNDLDSDCLPLLLNIRTHRHLWHCGVGKDNEPPYDRLEEMSKELSKQKASIGMVELGYRAEMEGMWQRLLKPSAT